MKFLEKRKFIFSAIIIFSFLFVFNQLFAYDEIIVHPSLTQEMAKLYNLNNGEKLTEQEIDWLKKGAKDEDDRQGLLIRSGNHFYNPFGFKKWVTNDTLIGNSVPEPKFTAKEWAHNSLEQDSFPGGDYTWERAIWDYANGDEQHAYESLGHIMHLIEDSAVPAHVRNDLHIAPGDQDLAPYQSLPRFEEIKKALQEDGEPYETWTGGKAKSQNLKFDFAENLFRSNQSPIALNSLDEYFDSIAKYTGVNFFSKDTIYYYTEPKNSSIEGSEKMVNGDIVDYFYGFDENRNKIKLAKVSYEKNKNQKIYTLIKLGSEIENNIYSDYWSRLAPRAVLTGAGIIKLFKNEANKALKNPQSIERPKSIASVYGPAAPIVKKIDPTIRTVVVIGQLLGNAGIYTAGKALTAAQNIIVSAYDSAKSSVIAVYDWGKSTAIASYNTVKNTTITVYNQTKTGLQLTGKYAFNSASSVADTVGGFFNSASNSISRYFTSTAKAELVFDISQPVKASTIAEIYDTYGTVIKYADRTEAMDDHGYKGELILASKTNIVSVPGQELNLKLWIKNTGAQTWQYNAVSLGVASDSDYREWSHPSWPDETTASRLVESMIRPGQTGTFLFSIKVPAKIGDYVFSVRPKWQGLKGETGWVTGSGTRWNIKVRKEEIAKIIPSPVPVPSLTPVAAPKPEPPITTIAPVPSAIPSPTPAIIYYSGGSGWSYATTPSPTPFVAPETVAEAEPPIITPTPTPVPDIVPPVTTILKSPADPTFETGAVFEFSSNEENSVFQCSLDNGDFLDCGDITKFENLTIGAHKLKVKAKDEAGNIEDPPKDHSWTIKKAEIAPHLVISEIQTGGVTPEDEFVELYNPTDQAINLTGYVLKKKTSSGTENNILSNIQGAIKPYGYFLITPRANCGESETETCYKGNIKGDDEYTTNNFLAKDNTVLLYDNNGKIIDKAGWGEAKDFETSAFAANPSAGQSLERKANAQSTSESLLIGDDKFLGNGWDTDDNSADFVLRNISHPQNSAGLAEPRPPAITGFQISRLDGDDIDYDSVLMLGWLAPAGDITGLVYDIRVRESDERILSQADFDGAAIIPDPPNVIFGAAQETEISNLDLNNSYCFAIQVKNAEGIGSEIVGDCYIFNPPPQN